MASHSGPAAAARPRSIRVPPNSSRSIVNPGPARPPSSTGRPPSSHGRPPSSHGGRPPSSAGRPPSSAGTNASGPTAAASHQATTTAASSLSIFLTNLRLLDLDLYPDWPDINSLTFSTKDIAQGQKKRIQCVEWALFHLFAIWDPYDARDRLQPFFPPLDQVQSLNLRAALLRSLEHAKKNGVLGRDAVVRKTMLDDCKGERLEEVLAAFSSAVLKRLVAEHHLNEPEFPAVAQTLALENRGYSGDRVDLSSLILAHKVSLHRALDRKNDARAQYTDFSQFLGLKEKTLARRQAQALDLQEHAGDEVSNDVKLDVWRTVRNNWSGNEGWMDALLYGDTHARKDGLLSTPFDRVWRRVESGRLAELEDKSGGMLEQLDDKVRSQKARLARWQSFRTKMFGQDGEESRQKSTDARPVKPGVDLGFRAHETLHLGRTSPRKLARSKPSQIQAEYDDVAQSLRMELAGLNQENTPIPAFFQQPTASTSETHRNSLDASHSEHEAVSELSELDDDMSSSHPPSPTRPSTKRSEPALRRTNRLHQERSFPSSNEADIAQWSPERDPSPAAIQPSPSPSLSPSPSPSPSPPARSPPRIEASPPRVVLTSPPRYIPAVSHRTPSPERPISPTQLLADQILASVNAASPSPLKKRHTLSLAERTRLSMARGSPLPGNGGGHTEPEVDPLPLKRGPSISDRQRQSSSDDKGGAGADEYEDLASRTRRSMAGFEAAQKKAQMERRRSLRKSSKFLPVGGTGRNSSYFPAVDEEENSTLLLAEELMGVEDQDAVFMSRPKIKTSPVGTPMRRNSWGDDD
ncbi:HAUS augmin-like complex subunit 6 N-terminus-domain-containing protein [Podospora conica]|nr:HAUS augmin-like complex subunit 6 N-terminus-domain-containing protein [Schizothecium conicum]